MVNHKEMKFFYRAQAIYHIYMSLRDRKLIGKLHSISDSIQAPLVLQSYFISPQLIQSLSHGYFIHESSNTETVRS